MTLENILADFQLLDDWEDRYRYVIELGRALPPLPEAARTEANRVRGCASQVWLATEVNGATDGAAPRLIFKGDSDAHIEERGRTREGGGREGGVERIYTVSRRAVSGEARRSEPRIAPTNNDPVSLCNLVKNCMTFLANDLVVTTQIPLT